ncbi:MAG: peptidylprolyl isomerase [Cyanobacteria bacterium J06598_3]
MTLGFGTAAKRWSVLVAIALLIGSCSEPASEIPPVTESNAPSAPPVAVLPDAAALTEGLVQLNGKATADITVGSSVIKVELDGDQAPITAGNFVDLAQKGVYDNTLFHRVINGADPFVAQGGDPQSKDPNFPVSQLGSGGYVDEATGQPREIPLEILTDGPEAFVYGITLPDAQIQAKPVLNHRKGAIAMARSGTNTASSQFYITLADLPFLDGNYAVFGYVTEGQEIVDNIQQGDVISSVKITSGGDNLVGAE